MTDIDTDGRRRLQDEDDAVEILNRAGAMLAAEPDLARLVQALTDAATEVTGAGFGAFFYNVLNEHGGSYTLYALSGVSREHFERFPMPRATALFGPTFRGEGIIRSGNIRQDPRYGLSEPWRGMPPGHLPVVSYLAVPVISRTGEVLGGLFFGHPAEDRFGEREERIVAGLAGQAAIAMDHARLLEAAHRARDVAEAANRLKDEFLATVSHELRTPLNAILGWTRLLQTTRAGVDVDKALTTIERNARAQAQIIEDLLDMSRIVSGRLRLDLQPVDLLQVVTSALAAVAPAAVARRIRIHSDLDPAAGAIQGDPGRLEQVCWNLLTNAIKFTPRDGDVTVTLERVDSHVEIRIRDTGEGIAPDALPGIFERFKQGDTSTTRRHGGLGLGLSIVRHLVEMHGGSVRARSDGPGLGSTFTVALPIRAVRTPAATIADAEAPAAAGVAGAPLEGLRVLAVDDDADARDLIALALRHAGAEVGLAASAAEARALLSDGRYDVLISDLGMPGEDGFALLESVRAMPGRERMPAIALSAYARAEDRRRALVGGFQSHLAKPVDPGELVALLADLMGSGS
jgi:signal transduction histidine kinase